MLSPQSWRIQKQDRPARGVHPCAGPRDRAARKKATCCTQRKGSSSGGPRSRACWNKDRANLTKSITTTTATLWFNIVRQKSAATVFFRILIADRSRTCFHASAKIFSILRCPKNYAHFVECTSKYLEASCSGWNGFPESVSTLQTPSTSRLHGSWGS